MHQNKTTIPTQNNKSKKNAYKCDLITNNLPCRNGKKTTNSQKIKHHNITKTSYFFIGINQNVRQQKTQAFNRS